MSGQNNNKLTIWKQQFELSDFVNLLLPKGAKILSCQVQDGIPCIWFLCDPSQPKETRILRVVGTGHPVKNEELKFIDTIQLLDGKLIFHIFELVEVWN